MINNHLHKCFKIIYSLLPVLIWVCYNKIGDSMNRYSLEIMLEFQKIIKEINYEISCNRGSKYYFSIEQILIHN